MSNEKCLTFKSRHCMNFFWLFSILMAPQESNVNLLNYIPAYPLLCCQRLDKKTIHNCDTISHVGWKWNNVNIEDVFMTTPPYMWSRVDHSSWKNALKKFICVLICPSYVIIGVKEESKVTRRGSQKLFIFRPLVAVWFLCLSTLFYSKIKWNIEYL